MPAFSASASVLTLAVVALARSTPLDRAYSVHVSSLPSYIGIDTSTSHHLPRAGDGPDDEALPSVVSDGPDADRHDSVVRALIDLERAGIRGIEGLCVPQSRGRRIGRTAAAEEEEDASSRSFFLPLPPCRHDASADGTYGGEGAVASPTSEGWEGGRGRESPPLSPRRPLGAGGQAARIGKEAGATLTPAPHYLRPAARSLGGEEILGGGEGEGEDDDPSSIPHPDSFYLKNGLLSLLCVIVAALAAGLTMGMLSLDPMMLLIKVRAASDPAERKQAELLLPLVRQRHRLLVTLLLLNSIANEALPLFLDEIVGGAAAVLISVTLVLFFGEIIPSAVFTGPNQLSIASRLVPLVRAVMTMLCPLAWPIAKALDVVLHNDDDDHDGGTSIYNRGELTALVRIQYEAKLAAKGRRKSQRRESHLSQRFTESRRDSSQVGRGGMGHRSKSMHGDEVAMVEGALRMMSTMALDVMTPLRKVFALPFEMELDERNVVEIYRRGYSRVPVYAPFEGGKSPEESSGGDGPLDGGGSIPPGGRIVGVLMTNKLIVVDPDDCRPVSTLPLRQPIGVPPTMNLVDLINLMQTGGRGNKGGHMAVVCARPGLANRSLDNGQPIPDEVSL